MTSILAVDDSASLRQMVAFTLRSSGYEVIEAIDGVDALEKLRERSVDLVLTDQNMPRMDGLTLVRPDDMPEAAVAPWCARPEWPGLFGCSAATLTASPRQRRRGPPGAGNPGDCCGSS